jgi:quercetin dioxygenase-like cupin family protein
MSQVERGLSKPTIDELRAIVSELDAPISLFFGRPEAPPQEQGRVVRADSRRQLGWAEVGLSEELLSPDLTDDFEMLRSSFEPGAKLGEFVKRPTQEVGYLVQGKLRMWIGEAVFDLSAGDSFRIRDEKFKWHNPYDETAVAIWVIAPPVY